MRRIVEIAYLALLLMIQVSIVSCKELNDDSARGTRIASNNQVTVYARNLDHTYIVHYSGYPYAALSWISYPDKTFFVYSLDVIKAKTETATSTNFTFVQVGAIPNDTASVLLSVVTVTVGENDTLTAFTTFV